jgi:hypothetical protein
MANQDAAFGFRPVGKVGGGVSNGGQTEYTIANGEASAIYQGDPVKLVANGNIDVANAAGDTIVGIFNGCFYTDPTTSKPTFANYYPGGVAAADIVAQVIDDPNQLFEVQVNGAFNVANTGENAETSYATGSNIAGTSKAEVDTFASNASSTWIVVGVSKDPDNSDTSSNNVNLIVKPNLHYYTGGKAGV